MIKKLLIVLMATIFIVSAGFAQTSETGAIRGTVTDPDGVTLPGITVTLKSPAVVVGQLTTVTNSNGVYRFLSLRPGEYELTFALEGMNTLVRKGIQVRVGNTSTVDVGMTLKSIEENVIVSGKAPTVDRQKTTGVASLDVQVLKMIPTANRSFNDYFNLTPGVTGDTAHGSGTMENSYNLDGVNVGDPATGTSMVSFGMDIMEEIAVQTGGISAEYGSVKGAVVNVVTKSGGNKFNGSVSFNFDHESLQAENTEGTDLWSDPELGPVEKTGRKFQMEPNVSIGGPIIKDKIWFFASANYITSETYAPGYPYDQEENIPADNKQFLPYFKLTLQPSVSDKFILAYNFSDRKRNHRGADRYQTEGTTFTQKTPTHTFNVHWTKTFGANLYANLKLAFVTFNMQLDSKTLGTMYSDWNSSRQSGTYFRNKDHNLRDRYQVVADATTFIDDFLGSHELKIGGELQYAKTTWLIETGNDNGFDYTLIYYYPEAYAGNHIYYATKIYGFERKEAMLNYSFYLNDTWSLTNNLTATIGVRYDYNSNIWPAQNQDEEPIYNPYLRRNVDRRITESMTPMSWKNLSPRMGLIYDMFSDGTTLLKASWSTYVEPNQVGWINIAHPNGWLGWREYLYGGTTPRRYQNWSTPSTTRVGHPDYPVIAPTSDELTVGLERELFEDWSIGARYIKKWDKNLIHAVNAASLDFTALMERGELIWRDFEIVTTTDPYNNQTVTFYNNLNPGRAPEQYIVNPPNAKRDYDGLELTLNKRYSHGWSINTSYVYSNSRGLIDTDRSGEALGTSSLYNNPNAHINGDGRFPLERRHQIKVTGLVKGPLGINLGGYFRFLSGNRWTRTISAEYLGLSLGQTTQTINAEKRGSSGYPNFVQLDLKLEKAFRFGGVEVKVFADMFNVFNSNTITAEYLNSSNPSRVFGEDTDIQAPRVVRLGASIEF